MGSGVMPGFCHAVAWCRAGRDPGSDPEPLRSRGRGARRRLLHGRPPGRIPGHFQGFPRALRGTTLFDIGRTAEAEQELRTALKDLLPLKEPSPNQYWEPFGLLTRVACANHANDCDALRAEATKAQSLSLAATVRARLREAVAP